VLMMSPCLLSSELEYVSKKDGGKLELSLMRPLTEMHKLTRGKYVMWEGG
jgi:hypothetical protein